MPDTLSCPASSPSTSTMNGSPCPERAFAWSARMLARVSKLIGPRGFVASHSRSQPRLSSSSRSSGRASRSRIGRTVIRPSLSVGMIATSLADGGGELLQPGAELLAEVLALARELHDGLDGVELVADFVATTAEHDAVHAARRVVRSEGLQRVGELDLPALAGRRLLEDG